MILLESLPEAAAGIGTVYECVTPAIVRSGLDALSNQLGELSVGGRSVLGQYGLLGDGAFGGRR